MLALALALFALACSIGALAAARLARWHALEARFWGDSARRMADGPLPSHADLHAGFELLEWTANERPSVAMRLRRWRPPTERRAAAFYGR